MEEVKITAEKLYEFITERMTPEFALKRLLESSVKTYEHLKFDEGACEQVHPLIIIANAVMDLGWDFALESGDGDKEMEGMVVGTPEYMNRIFSKKEE